MEPSHYNLTARVTLPYDLTARVPLPYDLTARVTLPSWLPFLCLSNCLLHR